jgi:hypothetical protein
MDNQEPKEQTLIERLKERTREIEVRLIGNRVNALGTIQSF